MEAVRRPHDLVLRHLRHLPVAEGTGVDPGEVPHIDEILELPAGGAFTHPVKAGHNGFVYVYEGGLEIGPAGNNARALKTHSAGVLSPGDKIEIRATQEGARFILLAGRPLNEPVVQYGPFVMNTREEIEQAVRDYQTGQLTQ